MLNLKIGEPIPEPSSNHSKQVEDEIPVIPVRRIPVRKNQGRIDDGSRR